MQKKPNLQTIPLTKSYSFIGREEAMLWLKISLNDGIQSKFLFLEGPPGIGKSALLKQQEAGWLGKDIFPVYLDIHMLDRKKHNEFLWGLAKNISLTLAKTKIIAPSFEKRMLILRPWQSFYFHFWLPLLKAMNDNMLLLNFDNFHLLTTEDSDENPSRRYREYLNKLLNTSNSSVAFLAAIVGRYEAYPPQNFSPLILTHRYRLPAFSIEETRQLLNQEKDLMIYAEVVDYIYELTSGNPADVLRLGNALLERLRLRRQRHPTLADVRALLETDLHPKDFHTAVYNRLDKTSIVVTSP